MRKGYVALVLHAHMPYVRHPEYESILEERWLFEVMTETYIPLLKVFGRLAQERVPCRLTFSLSPTLITMMEDTLLQQRYRNHLLKLIELCGREQERNQYHPHLAWLAQTYRRLHEEALDLFDSYRGRLVRAFAQLHEQGILELITCSATHAVLPLLAIEPKAIRAQIANAVELFNRTFGMKPAGFWLPECSYIPGIEEMLHEQGIRYFFLEAHGIAFAQHQPVYEHFAPLYTPCGVAAFGRDMESSEEVWSPANGFPGNPQYREFYRDIGHELPLEYIQPYLEGSVRVDTGIKYWRITGKEGHKEFYDPYKAREQAAIDAGHFLHQRIHQVENLSTAMQRPPLIVSAFDAELFGHWWYEGPQWLDFFIRKTVYDQSTIGLVSPGVYLDDHAVQQMSRPAMSSWGHKGYFEYWCNEKTDWVVAHVNECVRRMSSLAQRFADTPPPPAVHRALNQCLRELLLAQCSDWPFIITTNTSVQYATRRVREHVGRFHFLADAIEADTVDEESLDGLEYIDNIFPNADYRVYA